MRSSVGPILIRLICIVKDYDRLKAETVHIE
jgi:hypothetical protein